MKCIDDELIQKFIDKETDLQETARIEKHLTGCSHCVGKVEKQKAFVEAVKRAMNRTIEAKPQPNKPVIPEFVAPNIFKYRVKKKNWYYISSVSAVCVIFLVVFLLYSKRTESVHNNTVQMFYSFDGEFDSNKTISQQEMTIIMIDANGKRIEYN
jgi:predicted anti-sigma-YlaC factor YlaD